jgi:hypothetical protein
MDTITRDLFIKCFDNLAKELREIKEALHCKTDSNFGVADLLLPITALAQKMNEEDEEEDTKADTSGMN